MASKSRKQSFSSYLPSQLFTVHRSKVEINNDESKFALNALKILKKKNVLDLSINQAGGFRGHLRNSRVMSNIIS